MIETLLKFGIKVKSIPEKDRRKVADGDTSLLKSGLLALVGTSWHKNQPFELRRTYCDYRLIAAGESGNGNILGAGYCYWDGPNDDILAKNIIENLASTLLLE